MFKKTNIKKINKKFGVEDDDEDLTSSEYNINQEASIADYISSPEKIFSTVYESQALTKSNEKKYDPKASTPLQTPKNEIIQERKTPASVPKSVEKQKKVESSNFTPKNDDKKDVDSSKKSISNKKEDKMIVSEQITITYTEEQKGPSPNKQIEKNQGIKDKPNSPFKTPESSIKAQSKPESSIKKEPSSFKNSPIIPSSNDQKTPTNSVKSQVKPESSIKKPDSIKESPIISNKEVEDKKTPANSVKSQQKPESSIKKQTEQSSFKNSPNPPIEKSNPNSSVVKKDSSIKKNEKVEDSSPDIKDILEGKAGISPNIKKKQAKIIENEEEIERQKGLQLTIKPSNISDSPLKISKVNNLNKTLPLKKTTTSIKRGENNWEELNKKIKNQEPHNPWECEKKFYTDQFQELKSSKKKFTDDIFVPSASSVHNIPKKPVYESYSQWKRLSDIYKGNDIKIYSVVDPNDINQGVLGDCYFLSSISSIAEKPERIERLFEDLQINDQNCYFVRLCIDGIWRYVVIDDFIPCDSSGRPIFSQSRADVGSDKGIIETWVLLLEKAWAKIFSTYENIEAGFPEDVLFAITGAPCKNIETESEDAWDDFFKANKRNWIMTGACGQDSQKAENLQSLGLVIDHAYSIINTWELDHKKEGKIKLVEIRNPWGWGSDEWSGKWSDNWAGWSGISPEKKKELQVGGNDGRFFMEFQDFVTYFDYVTVCMMEDSYYFVSYPIRSDRFSYSIRKFNLEKGGTFFLTLTQKDQRYFRKSSDLDYQYRVVRLILGRKLADGSFEHIEGVSDQKKSLTITVDETIQSGEYYVAIIIDHGPKIFDCTLTYYGSESIEFERVDYKKYNNLLNEIMVEGGKGKLLFTEKKKDYVYSCYVSLEEGLVIEVFSNNTERNIDVLRNYSKINSQEYAVIHPEIFQNNFKFKINVPGKKKVSLCSKILDLYAKINNASLKNSGFTTFD